jgi:hypothetical protein
MAARLSDLIRSKLDEHALPWELPAKLYAGYGGGAPCCACGDFILQAQVQYDVSADHETFRFHLGCFGLWEAECRRRGWRRKGAAGGSGH